MNMTKSIAGLICLGLSICFLWTGAPRADDTDVYTRGMVSVPPNILIIFDPSGSMSVEIPTSTTFDSAQTYSGSYTATRIYYKDGNRWTGLEKNIRCKTMFYGICREFTSDPVYLNDIVCKAARTALSSTGQWMGYLQVRDANDKEIYTYDCPTSTSDSRNRSYQLATGNYLNFKAKHERVYRPKVDVAKDAVKKVLDMVTEGSVRFGLMRFHGQGTTALLPEAERNRGGYLLAKIGSSHAAIKAAVDNIRVWCSTAACGSESHYTDNPYTSTPFPIQDHDHSSGGTPLAETLAEAGLYFAGKASWANTAKQKEPGYPGAGNDFGVDGVYTSPIEWRCQKNYIIVITDGMSQADEGDGNGDNIFTRADYINGKSIGRFYSTSPRDIDRDGDCTSLKPKSCEHFMDDTAKFLYDVDLIDSTQKDQDGGGSFNDDEFPPQRVVTYTIGFGSECDKETLDRVTDNEHGHGKNLMATDGESLSDALEEIINDIMGKNGTFVTPVAPVSKTNRLYSGNSFYTSMFRTDAAAFWMGNLKKFGYSRTGQVLDRSGTPVEDLLDGGAKPSSCWGTGINDWLEVDKGGAGRQVKDQAVRNFYTYYNDDTSPNPTSLTSAANAFSVGNDLLTDEVFHIDGVSQTREDLISYVRADGDYAGSRTWVLGDIMHSRPAVMRDGNKNYIYVGANDGFLHCFEDNEQATYENLNDDVITEKWCFIPWALLSKLTLMKTTSTHQYFVDGSPVLYSLDGYKYLTFGLRRGGSNYYTLKVGSLQNGEWKYMDPVWAWEINRDNPSFSFLGESWCDPRVCKLKAGGSSLTALVLAGGYDSESQDLATPPTEDTRGCGIYAVNASNGNLLSNVLNLNRTSPGLSSMTRCIVDLVAFDSNSDGFTDRIYAGDMGGQIFALKGPADGSAWTGRKIFQAGDGTSATAQLKFFYAPDVALQGYQYKQDSVDRYSVVEYVYGGTGDREHPLDITFDNRFYGIKNIGDNTVLTESSLTDVTYYSTGYSLPHDASYLKGMNSKGWFIRLGYELGEHKRPGEQVVSSPIVFDGIVYFTTYAPDLNAAAGDKCLKQNDGEGFLYAVDYLTGEAIREFNFSLTEEQKAGKVGLNETNRRYSFGQGSGMPTKPRLTMTDSGPVLTVGTKDGPITFPVPRKSKVKEYFWLQK